MDPLKINTQHVAAGWSEIPRVPTEVPMPRKIWSRHISIDEGFVGFFCRPVATESASQTPVVIRVGGSEGGIDASFAKMLARDGIACLSVAYHKGCSNDARLIGVPQDLHNIDLEYFMRAARWVESQRGIIPKRTGICGSSRGAELAYLLASHFPDDFRAIAALAPSAKVYAAVGHDMQKCRNDFWAANDPLDWAPAWRVEGRPIPHGTTIALQNIKAPVLTLSGDADLTWRSAAGLSPDDKLPDFHNAEFIHQNLLPPNPLSFAKHFPLAGHLIYPQELLRKRHPEFKTWIKSFGGTETAALDACSECSTTLKRFFRIALE